MQHQLIDHLFRHHSGKMVAVLTRVFGLSNLEVIEDAVQDTFIKATLSWRNQLPDNPEAWLIKASKNRVLDIFRKLQSEKKKLPEFSKGIDAVAINELFLDSEIEDAQLRMIFTACHPKLNPKDRIAFALKTVSGFSGKEIASALLLKEETVKKRLVRARKAIQQSNISFSIPQGLELPKRIESVLEVLYLIFNEGFHSNTKEQLVRKELCGEAMRLCKLVIKNKHTSISASYALFALMCFHSARLDAKVTTENEVLDLKNQDRSKWYFPLIQLGNTMMNKAVEKNEFSSYHYEAAIIAEHLKAETFNDTNWEQILFWYESLYELQPMPTHLLTMAVVCLQMNNYVKASFYFDKVNPQDLEQRAYLYYAAKSDYYYQMNDIAKAIEFIDIALEKVTNQLEKEYLERKKSSFSSF
ncbi:RNA polymerase sigma factor [Tenacibaculum sp. MEBiC06402]|uniref:RNA polymerase sigma factor n=1 Tax=unclassified Tenacibaculum TaxID=2635139 RepID=UPI003B9D126E